MSSQDPAPATLAAPPEMLFGIDIKTISYSLHGLERSLL